MCTRRPTPARVPFFMIGYLRVSLAAMALPPVVCFVFAVLAAWHFYMARVPRAGDRGVMPTVNGKPLFTPTRTATAAVGVVLFLFALLVAATAGIISLRVPQTVLTWLSFALALGLLGRAVGDFKYVGFFKRVQRTKFARLDTLLYSPLCLMLAVGVALVALQHGTVVRCCGRSL